MARNEFQKSYQDRTNFGRIIGFIVGKQKVCVGGGVIKLIGGIHWVTTNVDH